MDATRVPKSSLHLMGLVVQLSNNKNYLINFYLMVHQNQGLTGNEPHFPYFQISEIEIIFCSHKLCQCQKLAKLI